MRTAAAALARRASFGGTIAWQLDDSLPVDLPDQARAVVDGVILGSYDPGQWKSKKPERREIERLVLVTDADLASQVDRAQRVATWTNRARDLSNMPPNELTPERLAEIAQEISTEVSGLRVEAFGLEQARELGMGAFSAVAQGAENPAQMIVMRYEPEGAPDGLVLGPRRQGHHLRHRRDLDQTIRGDGGHEARHVRWSSRRGRDGSDCGTRYPRADDRRRRCHREHAGRWRLPPWRHPHGQQRQDDRSDHTDAEGRLVLADALVHARGLGATHVVDLATLTGAMVIALGDIYAGVFANDDDWRERIIAAGAATGDRVWPMPMDPRYRSDESIRPTPTCAMRAGTG